jgi:hypothetical protein
MKLCTALLSLSYCVQSLSAAHAETSPSNRIAGSYTCQLSVIEVGVPGSEVQTLTSSGKLNLAGPGDEMTLQLDVGSFQALAVASLSENPAKGQVYLSVHDARTPELLPAAISHADFSTRELSSSLVTADGASASFSCSR